MEKSDNLGDDTENSGELTRREFVKHSVAGAALLAGAGSAAFAAPTSDVTASVVGALGAVFIPSRPGDPGYKELERYGITRYVLTNPLRPLRGVEGGVPEIGGAEIAETFNDAAKQFFAGKSFLELEDQQKEQYLELILDGSKIADAEQRAAFKTLYRAVRFRVMDAYYKNYPEHEPKRNSQGEPILKPGDLHQITNPNTEKIVTGWDIAGFKGPLTWEDEEKHRAAAKKMLPYWFEGDLVKLNPSRPPAAAPIKTSDGLDYYDVIVLGGGTAGCMVAGRLAERGINPKTGDRLRIAMIEGGQDWTIRDPGVRPGYGYPIRRRMITNILNEENGPEGYVPGPAYRWPYEGAENFKLVGGMSNHYQGNVWIPEEDDFRIYREESGVDWDLAKFADAIQEVVEMFHVTVAPSETWSKADHLFADAGRALGYQMNPSPVALRNCLGSIFETAAGLGAFSRYDTKGTSLPWAYIGMNHGLKVIPNANVEKILIEKVPGARPVATGAVYTDKSGAKHEVRAARVIVACAALGTPSLLYRSGYGPRDYLGDQLLVENKFVGRLSGDAAGGAGSVAYFAEPVAADGLGIWGNPWTSPKSRPWSELNITITTGGSIAFPNGVALGPFAPEFGWKHKEFMRSGNGMNRIMNIGATVRTLPWSWRVRPDNQLERAEIDAPRIDAALKEGGELAYAWYDKLAIKPLKIERNIRPATSLRPNHHTGSARAGVTRETSVCGSDFDCHDIDRLLFTSAAVVPRTTFSWSMGPTAVAAAYGWRRMLANHFSRGCSTKGFA